MSIYHYQKPLPKGFYTNAHPKLWNSLPNSIKFANSLAALESGLQMLTLIWYISFLYLSIYLYVIYMQCVCIYIYINLSIYLSIYLSISIYVYIMQINSTTPSSVNTSGIWKINWQSLKSRGGFWNMQPCTTPFLTGVTYVSGKSIL